MSSILPTIITFALAVGPWFLPDLAFQGKIIFTLLIAFIYCIAYCIFLSVEIRNLKKELVETKGKHNALATRFDINSNKLHQYQDAFNTLTLSLHLAWQSPTEDKLKDLYMIAASLRNQINDDGGI